MSGEKSNVPRDKFLRGGVGFGICPEEKRDVFGESAGFEDQGTGFGEGVLVGSWWKEQEAK